jgi:hypothetical protein
MGRLIWLGKKFGILYVCARERALVNDCEAKWLCMCVCGRWQWVAGRSLTRHKRAVRRCSACANRSGEFSNSYRHGKSNTPEYRTWVSMRHRCNNPRCRDYPEYGGRGIKICARWRIFETFLIDMGPRPAGGKREYSIERLDVNGDYEPGNCEWILDRRQHSNKRTNHYVIVNGEKMTMTEWARRNGVSTSCIYSRIRRNQTLTAASLQSSSPGKRPLDNEKFDPSTCVWVVPPMRARA